MPLLLLGVTLHADTPTPKKSLLEQIAAPKVSWEHRYLSDAGISNNDGSVTTTANRLKLNNLFLNVEYTHLAYHWSDVDNLPFGNGVDAPFEEVHGIRFDLRGPYRFNDQWFSLTSIGVSSTFEKEISGALSVNLFSFFAYKLDADHTINMGAFGYYNPTASLVLPVVSYGYRARQNDGLSVVLGFPRTFVGYHVTPKVRLATGFIYNSNLIRLKDDSTVTPKGFLQVRDYLANAGLTYKVTPHIELHLDVIYTLQRELTFYRNSGKELDTYTLDPSAGLNLKATWLF